MTDTTMETITDYLDWYVPMGARLKEAGYKYGTREEFVLAHGAYANSDALTPAEESFLSLLFTTRKKLFRMKYCFENATDLVHWATRLTRHAPDMDVKYGEGFALGEFFPIHHAVMLLNGKPIDVTWRKDHTAPNTKKAAPLLERVKHNMATNTYFMVSFDELSLNRELLRTKTYGIIDKDLCKEGPLTKWED